MPIATLVTKQLNLVVVDVVVLYGLTRSFVSHVSLTCLMSDTEQLNLILADTTVPHRLSYHLKGVVVKAVVLQKFSFSN